jgi:hypothetical protein
VRLSLGGCSFQFPKRDPAFSAAAASSVNRLAPHLAGQALAGRLLFQIRAHVIVADTAIGLSE